MNIYLLQNERQDGPFTEEEVRQMLQKSLIDNDTLGWREGMADWGPLSSLGLSASAPFTIAEPPTAPLTAPPTAPPPSPAAPRPTFGLISLIISGASLAGWAVLLIVAGLATSSGTATQTFYTVVACFAIGGFALNFVGLILGVVGTFKSRSNTLAILGACLNAFILAGLVVLMIIGLAGRAAQQS